jgi:uncharacterized membrane protein
MIRSSLGPLLRPELRVATSKMNPMSRRQDDTNNPLLAEPLKLLRPGVYVYAAGSIAAGIMNLIWRDFEPAHQPIQALGDHIPGREIFAYIGAIWLVAGGAAILRRGTARTGAAALAAIYLIFAAFWLPRFYTAPHALGFRIPLLIGLLVGVAQQLILAAAAAIIYALLGKRDPARVSKILLIVRWIFGLSSVDFGLAHLTAVRQVSAMVPKWMPFGGDVWTVLTGLAFVLAGMAILFRILDVLAARLLALMLFIFSVFVLAPRCFADPRNHVSWGSSAYNLAAVGAVWIFAELIRALRRKDGNEYPDDVSITYPSVEQRGPYPGQQ